MVYQGNENLIDAATLDLLVDRLAKNVDLELAKTKEDNYCYTHGLLSSLNSGLSPECMARLRSLSGATLEAKLVELGTHWSSQWRRNYAKTELTDLIHVLHRIGGTGLAKVINQEIQAPLGERWHVGLQWASIRPDGQTLSLVKATVDEFNAIDDPNEIHKLDCGAAIQALIAHGEIDSALPMLGSGKDIAILGGTDELRKLAQDVPDNVADQFVAAASERGLSCWPLLFLAASTKRQDAIDLIRKLVRDVSPQDKIASGVLEAFLICGGMALDDLPLVIPFLEEDSTCAYAINLLLSLGQEHALPAFENATRDKSGLKNGSMQSSSVELKTAIRLYLIV